MATAILYKVTPPQGVPFLAIMAVKVGGGLKFLSMRVTAPPGPVRTWRLAS
jgi:hypothetical protein